MRDTEWNCVGYPLYFMDHSLYEQRSIYILFFLLLHRTWNRKSSMLLEAGYLLATGLELGTKNTISCYPLTSTSQDAFVKFKWLLLENI